jgi:hypothetical protein
MVDLFINIHQIQKILKKLNHHEIFPINSKASVAKANARNKNE